MSFKTCKSFKDGQEFRRSVTFSTRSSTRSFKSCYSDSSILEETEEYDLNQFHEKLLRFTIFPPFFSNFTAQSSSLTSLASTLSEGLNESTKRSSVGDQPNAKFASAIIVTDLESNLHDVSARLQSWPSSPKSEWQKNLPVVVLRGATKNYGSKKSPKCVLDKLNMTVKEGCM